MNILVPIADASEDIELACITDVLARAGATVVTASVMPAGRTTVTLARGLTVVASCHITECVGKQWDAIACPGGMPGAEHLRDSAELKEILLAQASASKLVAAVCAAPAVVFAPHGLLPARATCFPVDKFKAVVPGWEDSKVVLDGNVITSQVLTHALPPSPNTRAARHSSPLMLCGRGLARACSLRSRLSRSSTRPIRRRSSPRASSPPQHNAGWMIPHMRQGTQAQSAQAHAQAFALWRQLLKQT